MSKNTKRPQPSVFTIGLVTALAAAGASANIVTNPGFESGTVDNTPVGWQVGFTGDAADPFVRVGDQGGLSPDEGNNHLQFRGNEAVTTGGGFVQQDLATAASTSYDLSFALGSNNPASVAIRVTVTSLGGTLGDRFDETFNITVEDVYTTHNRNFSAINAQSTLRFIEVSAASMAIDPFLDDVSVTSAGPAIPAPAALPAGLALFVGFTATRRRRRG